MIIYRKKCYFACCSVNEHPKTNNKQSVCLSGSQATSEATKQLKQQTSLLVSQFSPVSQSQSVSLAPTLAGALRRVNHLL